MALSRGFAPDVVLTSFDELVKAEFTRAIPASYATAEQEIVFRQRTTDRNAVITELYQDPGYFVERAERQVVPEGNVRVGQSVTHRVVNWSLQVPISKNLFDDDMHETVGSMISSVGRNGRETRDLEAFRVYNNSFTTQLTNDAVAVFSNSHVRLDGGAVDNLETGTLTAANLETLINSLIEQRTQSGVLGGHAPNCLLVPTALVKEAMEITKSELRPGTANNDINYYSLAYPGLQLRYTPYIGAAYAGGSNVQWYLLSSEHNIRRYVRQALETTLVDWKTQANNDYIYKAEYREIVATPSWEGTVGSNGTV